MIYLNGLSATYKLREKFKMKELIIIEEKIDGEWVEVARYRNQEYAQVFIEVAQKAGREVRQKSN
jgi:bifunctional DNA-binding transcriptional regulator/antitoxin component of YhaV-PrlF toxin-antitoxin module